jgi:mono/diheme cytochrome c family protein
VRRPLLIVLFALLLAGCGGEKVVSPTGPVEGEVTTTGATTTTAEKGDPAAGKKVFVDSGCGGCHTFKAAASKGAIGPNLDDALKGKDADFIRESIVEPNKEIASGFQPNLMPQDYGSQLTPKQIADLVAFLQQGT